MLGVLCLCLATLVDLDALPPWISTALANATLLQRSGHIMAAIESLRQLQLQLAVRPAYAATGHGLGAEIEVQLAIWLYKGGDAHGALEILKQPHMQSVAANDPMAQLVIGAAVDSIAKNGRDST
jgi:hypothetical protein